VAACAITTFTVKAAKSAGISNFFIDKPSKVAAYDQLSGDEFNADIRI